MSTKVFCASLIVSHGSLTALMLSGMLTFVELPFLLKRKRLFATKIQGTKVFWVGAVICQILGFAPFIWFGSASGSYEEVGMVDTSRKQWLSPFSEAVALGFALQFLAFGIRWFYDLHIDSKAKLWPISLFLLQIYFGLVPLAGLLRELTAQHARTNPW